jgi:hypothetical protein
MYHSEQMQFHEFVENFSLAMAVMTFTVGVSTYLYTRMSMSNLCDKIDKFDKRFNAWDDRYDEWEEYFDDWDDRIPQEEEDDTLSVITTDAPTEMEYHTHVAECGEYVHYMKHGDRDFMLILPRQEAIRGRCILNVFFRRETRSTRGHVQMTYVDLAGDVHTMSIIRNDSGLHGFLSEFIDE